MSRERQEPEKWLFTNALMRQAILAIGEVMGERGLKVVLRQAGMERYVDELPPNDLEQGISTTEYAALNQEVEEFYGRAGKGMLKRIGRASFRYGVEEQTALIGVAGAALKLMPQKTRIKFILTQTAKSLMDVNDETYIEIQETPEGFVFADFTCGVCCGRKAEHPICHLYIGSISEAVKWATGHDYKVREIECRAMGAEACCFLVAERE
ncbi:MAG: V4R domain-containing protein [Chloroflexota bacterium]|nr:V4R domain-containing protein [Chloroflexota bacterium]